MTKLEQLQKKHAEELVRARTEETICALLPVEPRSIYAHKKYASVSYEVQTFQEAVGIVSKYEPVIYHAEHWKNACLSVMPEPINEYAKDERATMDGESYCELLLHSFGEGRYQQQELHFFVRLEGYWLKVDVRFKAPFKWLPSVTVIRDSQGHKIDTRIQPLGLGEDQFRRWSTDKPDYRFSYYWADVHNWRSWVDCEAEKLEVKP